MTKENNDKNQNYSGNSIASHWLSGTWLGNLLGYGKNTYTDGYGTERQNPSLKESAQGRQLDRMKDTAKNYGNIALMGMSFGNPLAARSTLGAALNTGAQSYFMTEGLRDAYNRFMKKDKTAGDALWAGLDLAGAVPAVGSVLKNGKYVFPEVKNALDRQSRITARQYGDYQPTIKLSNIPNGESSKPFTYLWDIDQSDAVNLKDVGRYEDATTQGFKDAQDIFLNKNIFNSFIKKPRIGIINSYGIGEVPLEEYSKIGVYPENVRFKSLPESTLGSATNYKDDSGAYLFAPNWFRKNYSEAKINGNIKLDFSKSFPSDIRSVATHEALHSKGLGLGIDPKEVYTNLLGEDYEMIINRNERLKYLYNYPEIAAHVLVDWKHLNPVKVGQSLPTSQKEWDKFIKQIQNSYDKSKNSSLGEDKDFHDFMHEILYSRNLLKDLNRTEDIQKLDKQLFEIFNGTAF